MRGEDFDVNQTYNARDGSPPHARGRLKEMIRVGRSGGITPACAGKTGNALSVRQRVQDHPRMRGEDGFIDLTIP